MKKLHTDNLYCWSEFDQDRNIDFHSYLWTSEQGNVVFDPLEISEHDWAHLMALGGVSVIVISNSDHVRQAQALADVTDAQIWAPLAEQEDFPLDCQRWLGEGKAVMDGLDVYALNGSKTPGELAFVVDGFTLITGDLVRAHSGGKLCMLPDGKLSNVDDAVASVKRLAAIEGITAVLPGDGWPVFSAGGQALADLVLSVKG
jgi:hypothetical protein